MEYESSIRSKLEFNPYSHLILHSQNKTIIINQLTKNERRKTKQQAQMHCNCIQKNYLMYRYKLTKIGCNILMGGHY